MVEVPNRPEYQSELFKKGLAVRREVLGADYVDGSLAAPTISTPCSSR
jgi:4-carboxymuconolactone decarboxylase